MDNYLNLRDRINEIIETKFCEKPFLRARDFYGSEWSTGSASTYIAEKRKSEAHLLALLTVYDKSGLEYSVSNQGERLVKREYPRQGALHKHDFIEIFYVIYGRFSQVLLGDRLTFEKGSFVITDQNCEHADFVEGDDAAVLFIQISPEFLDNLLHAYDKSDELQRFFFHALSSKKREESILQLVGDDSESTNEQEILVILERLLMEDIERQPSYEMIEEGYLIRLLKLLSVNYKTSRYSSSTETKEQKVLYEVERYIRGNFADVTIDLLEKEFHYSRNYYTKLLKKYRGMSFREYVQNIRMRHAKTLLLETDMPIKQIAAECGYENTSFFYNTYSKHFGCSPSADRGE